MITAFENYLRLQKDLSLKSISRICVQNITRKLRLNELLFHQGELCRHKVFVISGLLRIFGTTPDGGEHILQFSSGNTWTLNAESYDHQTPSRYNIGAVETERPIGLKGFPYK